ncbi:MAG: hypothetical protein FWB76_04135 [Oscillospiraceae bacterium]|nr:hypothetical protein [Oscillospiraceae bacterium]
MNKSQLEMDHLMYEEERRLIKQLSSEPMSLRQFGRAIKLNALIRSQHNRYMR